MVNTFYDNKIEEAYMVANHPKKSERVDLFPCPSLSLLLKYLIPDLLYTFVGFVLFVLDSKKGMES